MPLIMAKKIPKWTLAGMFIKRPQPDGTYPLFSKMLPAGGSDLTKSKLTQIWHSRDEPLRAEGLRADLLFRKQLTRGARGLEIGSGSTMRAKNAAPRGIRGLYQIPLARFIISQATVCCHPIINPQLFFQTLVCHAKHGRAYTSSASP